jgi:hypothetical protein
LRTPWNVVRHPALPAMGAACIAIVEFWAHSHPSRLIWLKWSGARTTGFPTFSPVDRNQRRTK